MSSGDGGGESPSPSEAPPGRLRAIVANLREVCDLPTRKQWYRALVSWVALALAFYGLYFLHDDDIDRQVLLSVNPDQYVPVLDEVVVAVTKFSMFAFISVFVAWEAGFLYSEYRPEVTDRLPRLYWRVGLVTGGIVASTYLWVGRVGFQYASAFLVLGCAWAVGFGFAGATFGWPVEERRHFNRVFWVAVLAAISTSIIDEAFLKPATSRPRPLAPENAGWNWAIRLVPNGVTREGYSYASGHASAFFAMVTPLFWGARRVTSKVAILLYAAFHAFTRVYLAAHFPYCALMGSLLGFIVASAMVCVFHQNSTSATRLKSRSRPT
ncbi:MAG: phosphatase PAP2 family protein [Promethearchaeota archaeon]